MAIIGIGLLPDQLTARQLIDFQHRWLHVFKGPPLDLESRVPHLTLYQFPVDASQIPDLPPNIPSGSAEWGDLVSHPLDWGFAEVSKDWFLTDAHRYVVNELFPHVDRVQLKDESELIGYLSSERLQYLTMGYRYGGVAFKPHVSLGRLTPDDLKSRPEMVDDFQRMFTGRAVHFGDAFLYRAGERGSVDSILKESAR